jgi:hypothetical protein
MDHLAALRAECQVLKYFEALGYGQRLLGERGQDICIWMRPNGCVGSG